MQEEKRQQAAFFAPRTADRRRSERYSHSRSSHAVHRHLPEDAQLALIFASTPFAPFFAPVGVELVFELPPPTLFQALPF